MRPTPDASATERDNTSASPGAAARPTLAKAVKLFPTPRAEERQQQNSEDNEVSLSKAVNGQLNPEFVEWLMGFPIS